MTLQLYDNTRISCHRKCARKFYWRHVRHFAPVSTRPALVFGSCWHKAMDAVWPAACSDHSLDNKEIVKLGAVAFMKEWTEEYKFPLYNDMSAEERVDFGFRHDETAYFMLQSYMEQRRSFMNKMELIEYEKPFAVPLDPANPELFYVGRLDKVVRWEGRIWVIEHKTTASYRKSGYFAPTWIDSFSPNSQIDGYLHALTMLYGKEAKGILIDAALVHKTVHEGFMFIPIERHLNQLEAWLWEAVYQISIIDNDMKYVDSFKTEAFFPAFPKNTGSCTEFNTQCSYLDLCKFIPNPSAKEETPQGFEVSKWEPFKELKLEGVIGNGKL
ncbi:hypothetical protein LCGC14_1710570 [marine sediment metagenome]|uniref:PD-(D/E)XK endonuclease-like domain-containing protein n=1 Tax=marine sediment metagenome TaxID=412755 RepID=A0A0F9HEX2_9ZZZZ